MKAQQPLLKNNKLMVIYRLEPDCLGEVGHEKIHNFCHYVTKSVTPLDSDFVMWLLLPRLEQKEQEIEYRVNGKRLNRQQVVKYLTVFDRDYDVFEERLNDVIMNQIDQYFS